MSHAGDTDPDIPSLVSSSHTEDKVNLEELEETSDEEEATNPQFAGANDSDVLGPVSQS